MPKMKYEMIYHSIKQSIENGKFPYHSYLPSEHEFIRIYDCTRNTVRRALTLLNQDGYILSQHGKGAQVIYQNDAEKNLFSIGGIESLQEATDRNNKKLKTKVIHFEETAIDEDTSLETGFDVGQEVYIVERVRIIDGEPLIHDRSIFLKSEVPNLTKKIAEKSIYQYLEEEKQIVITTSKRRVTAEKATAEDKRLLHSEKYDFVLVVSGQVFNSKGVMFEYTQSRHHPTKVCFVESALRTKR